MWMRTNHLLALVVIGATTSCAAEQAQTDTVQLRVLYLVNADGTLGQNLTHTPEGRGSWVPSFSSDCLKIAFASDRDDGGGAAIYMMYADGSNIRRLTKPGEGDWDYQPIFSPDGNRVLYIATVNDKRTIWVMDADGANQRPLTDMPGQGEYLGHPWSPDGSKFLFHGDRDLFLTDPDGSNVRRLTEARDTTEYNYVSLGPSWSRDGTKILFGSNRDGNWEVWAMKADGSNQLQLTHTSGGISNEPVAWSPDGTQVVFNRNYEDVYVMDADGSNVRRLTTTSDTGGRSRAIRWLAIGIDFVSRPVASEEADGFVMDPDGTNVRRTGGGGHDAVCPWY
jgi:Tol biopolymer transport system component